LRKQAPTFEPRVDPLSPRQKKQAFLASNNIMPRPQPAPTGYYPPGYGSDYGLVDPGEAPLPEGGEREVLSASKVPGLGTYGSGSGSKYDGIIHFEENNDVKINHKSAPPVRRQQELQSSLFGHGVE